MEQRRIKFAIDNIQCLPISLPNVLLSRLVAAQAK
jgi:hypothetical protein